MINGSLKGPVPPTMAALVLATSLAWAMPVAAAPSAEPADNAEATPPAAPPTPAPTPAPARTPLNLHAYWDDRLVIENEGKNFFLQPIAILQTLFTAPYNSSAYNAKLDTGVPAGRSYEGIGFTLRRAALGFDSRFLGYVRTFFLANIANGTMTLWDFFVDLDPFEGKAVLRAGRFRPWLGRQRLLAGDRYQMIQLPSAMTDILEFGDGRDLGAGIFGLLANKKVEYSVGVWNGEQRYANDPQHGYLPSSSLRNRGNIDFEFGGRLVAHPFGYLPAIDESDLAYSDNPKLSVGVAAMFAKRHDVRIPSESFIYYDDRLLKAGLELDFRYRGFSLEAEAFFRKAWLQPNPRDDAKKEFESFGFGSLAKGAYAQAGMFVLPSQLELTGRFDIVDIMPTKPGYIMRPALGTNLFLHGYNLLVQFMYRANLARGDFESSRAMAGALRPNDRTDVNLGDRTIARTTHDFFLMLQTSI